MATMLASEQTAAPAASTLPAMVNRLGTWWQLWAALAVIWTLAAAASAWLDMPRVTNIPHEPGFLSQLSREAAAIVQGSASAAEPARGAALWSDTPRLVRMPNGEQLTLPAFTTKQHAAIVETEYRRLLDARAGQQLWPYLLARLAWWLAPMLIVGGLLKIIVEGGKVRRGPAHAGD